MLFRRPDTKLDTLREVSIFRSFPDKELQLVAQRMDDVRLTDGMRLARQGETGREMFVLVDGKARVERNGHEIARVGPSDVVGEIALIDAGPRTADVVMEGDGRAYVMHAKDFSDLLHGSPDFALRVLEALAARLRAADDQLI